MCRNLRIFTANDLKKRGRDVLVNTVDTKLEARLKDKGDAYLSNVVPKVVDIFKAALEQLHAPVESPRVVRERFRAKFDARTLLAFVGGFVTDEHAKAAGVKRKRLIETIVSSMARYGLYVPFAFFAFPSYSWCSNRTLPSLMRGGR